MRSPWCTGPVAAPASEADVLTCGGSGDRLGDFFAFLLQPRDPTVDPGIGLLDLIGVDAGEHVRMAETEAEGGPAGANTDARSSASTGTIAANRMCRKSLTGFLLWLP